MGSMADVIALLDRAQKNLKQLKIVLALDDGTEFRLSIAGARAFSHGSRLLQTDLRYRLSFLFSREGGHRPDIFPSCRPAHKPSPVMQAS